MIDLTITLGNMIEAASIAGGVIVYFIKKDASLTGIKTQLTDMKEELKKLAGVVTNMALADFRLANAEQDIRDLQRGRGLVTEEFPHNKERAKP